MSKKVVFAGAYGIQSQGDDAALVVMYKELCQYFPGLEGVVVCRHAGEDLYAPYGMRSVPNFEYASKSESVGKWFQGFNFSDDRTNLCRLYREICESNLLVLGAGNALVDYSIDLLRGPIPYFVILTLMAHMAGTPVMWFGISVGPLRTDYGRDLTRMAARLANIITVRDERSIDELRGLDFNGEITLLPDPVLGLEPVGAGDPKQQRIIAEANNRGGPLVALSVRNIPDSPELSSNHYLDVMATVCDRLAAEKKATLLFVPQCTYSHGNPLEDDRQVAVEVVRRMKMSDNALVVQDHLSIRETQGLYAGASVALCTRLHGNVCAAIEGVPTVAVSYNPKVASFMQWLGCPELVVTPAIFSINQLMARLDHVFEERDQLAQHMRRRTAEGRHQIGEYVTLAAKAMQAVPSFT
ncbi:MAG: polysaccharide pyruvyl transferase family protein [Deltaproteobacteria bacterium]|nr:polysaccharide pyruvyl transferase family protein [Deltaproteobacteria bacterium]